MARCRHGGPLDGVYLTYSPLKPQYRNALGMRWPLGFPVAAIESINDFTPLDDDIVVVSYPKSGTTWLQFIVWLLVRQRELGDNETLTDCFPHLEELGAARAAAQEKPRLIKTHLQRSWLKCSDRARYIVIARNPFDCVVSFYHHTRGFPRHYEFADGRFEAYFDCFLAGEVDFGDYFDHLLSWSPEQCPAQTLFVTYETLKRDARSTISRLARFLGRGVQEFVDKDGRLDWVIETSSFDRMRKKQRRWSSRRPESAPAFIRKGQIGDWRSLMSRAQARALLAKFDQRLQGSSLAMLWPEEIEQVREFAR